MAVVSEGAQPVEGGDGVPERITITQSSASLDINRDSELSAGLLPKGGKTIGVGVARPRPGLAEDVDCHLTAVAVREAAHFTRAGEFQQRSPCFRVGLG